jgi:hypothetical protein
MKVRLHPSLKRSHRKGNRWLLVEEDDDNAEGGTAGAYVEVAALFDLE